MLKSTHFNILDTKTLLAYNEILMKLVLGHMFYFFVFNHIHMFFMFKDTINQEVILWRMLIFSITTLYITQSYLGDSYVLLRYNFAIIMFNIDLTSYLFMDCHIKINHWTIRYQIWISNLLNLHTLVIAFQKKQH